jgi:hypothetical protein
MDPDASGGGLPAKRSGAAQGEGDGAEHLRTLCQLARDDLDVLPWAAKRSLLERVLQRAEKRFTGGGERAYDQGHALSGGQGALLGHL